MPNATTPNTDLWIARALTLGPVALAFPVATWLVFGLGTDRKETADVLALIYSFGLVLGFSTSLWPLPSLRRWTLTDRVQSLCLLFIIVSSITHLSWELVWLIAHDAIAAARDAAWAYPWSSARHYVNQVDDGFTDANIYLGAESWDRLGRQQYKEQLMASDDDDFIKTVEAKEVLGSAEFSGQLKKERGRYRRRRGRPVKRKSDE